MVSGLERKVCVEVNLNKIRVIYLEKNNRLELCRVGRGRAGSATGEEVVVIQVTINSLWNSRTPQENFNILSRLFTSSIQEINPPLSTSKYRSRPCTLFCGVPPMIHHHPREFLCPKQ